MKFSAFAACVLLGCAGAASSSTSEHPIQNVIKMLEGLAHTVEEEAKAEEILFTKFEYWCRTSEKTLQGAVAEAKSGIDELSNTVAAKTEELATLGEQIKALEEQLGQLALSDRAAGDQRAAETALYTEAHKAIGDTIVAISSALKALQDAEHSTTGLLLAQRRVRQALPMASAVATAAQRQLLANFVKAADEPLAEVKASGDHDKHIQTYGFKSNNIIELLKELKAKFEEQQLEGTKAETNAANAFALQDSASKAAAAAAEESKTTKVGEQTAATTALNAAKDSLSELQSQLEADSETLSATQKQCSVKRTEWAERTKTRAQELQGLEAAQKILAKVSGVRTEAPSNPVPPPSPVSSRGAALVQAAPLQVKNPKLRAVELLRAQAKATHSKALERLAQEVSVRILDGPFEQVNNMIQKMIFQLMKEQTDEDNHKNWCDLELNKTEISLTDKAERLTQLKAAIDESTAAAQMLALSVKEAQEMVSTIDAHVAEATEIRETGKRENEVALKDAQDAQASITDAIAVLEGFYKGSGMLKKESWEFVQRGVELPEEPATWEASYTGVADPSNQPDGIIAVLERVSSEFAKMEGETRAQEVTDQKAYQEEMKACEIEKARLNSLISVKSQEQKRLVEKTASLESTHKHVSSEHEATAQYLKDLQPACVEGDSTYEERKAARSQEVQALKEAQGILADAFKEDAAHHEGEPSSFLQRRSAMRMRGARRTMV